jgi:L-rhamnose mutarotase
VLEQVAFKMQLNPGKAAECRRPHDAIRPELSAVLREVGTPDYCIFLDAEIGNLFAVLWRAPDRRTEQLPHKEIMQRSWQPMAHIMATQSDGSPCLTPLQPMSHPD